MVTAAYTTDSAILSLSAQWCEVVQVVREYRTVAWRHSCQWNWTSPTESDSCRLCHVCQASTATSRPSPPQHRHTDRQTHNHSVIHHLHLNTDTQTDNHLHLNTDTQTDNHLHLNTDTQTHNHSVIHHLHLNTHRHTHTHTHFVIKHFSVPDYFTPSRCLLALQ